MKLSNLILLMIILSIASYTFMVKRERLVQEYSSPNGVCTVTVFYTGGLVFGYDFRARVSSKNQTVATVRLGIYDLRHDVDLNRIKFAGNAIQFDLLYSGEKITVACDDDDGVK